MKKKSIIILSIILFFVVVSYIALNNLMLSALLLATGILFFYLSQKNNLNRKENLNIIRDEDKLYFYLSDDLLYTVDLLRNQSITETLKASIESEMSTIKDMTRKICFINFKDDHLLNELNHALHFKQQTII